MFIGPKFNKYFSIKCKKLKIKYDWIPTIKFIYFFSLITSFIKIRKYKPDIIMVHNYYIVPCIFYKIFFQRVEIIYVNHTPANLLNYKDMMMKYFHSFLSKLIFLNRETFNFAKKNFNISKKKNLFNYKWH